MGVIREFTPSHLYDLDGLYGPDFGSDGDFDNPYDDWLDFGWAGGAPPCPPTPLLFHPVTLSQH